MAKKFQIKRGNKTNLPTLSPGEFGLCIDTEELFIGGSAGNIKMPKTAADVGAAPTGYGLGGTYGDAITDVHAVDKCGSYHVATSASNLPADSNGETLVTNTTDLVVSYSNYNCREIYLFVGGWSSGYIPCLRQQLINGAWKEWEWVDPPLRIGTEYRTTERYNNKPVYYKLWQYGNLPNTTSLDIEHGIANVASISIDLGKSVVTNVGSFPNSEYNNLLPLHPNITKLCARINDSLKRVVTIETTSNLSSYKAALCLKYTKTTD